MPIMSASRPSSAGEACRRSHRRQAIVRGLALFKSFPIASRRAPSHHDHRSRMVTGLSSPPAQSGGFFLSGSHGRDEPKWFTSARKSATTVFNRRSAYRNIPIDQKTARVKHLKRSRQMFSLSDHAGFPSGFPVDSNLP
ncbi:MAG: hypothetical protein V4801_41205, partial [Burkholderia gladioli]